MTLADFVGVEARAETPTRLGNWREQYDIHHIAIFGDGNRRWAEARGVASAQGHAQGLFRTLPAVLEGLSAAGVHTQTYFGFATLNWQRSAAEIDAMMTMFGEFAEKKILDIARRHDARIVHLGTLERVPARLAALAASLTRETRSGARHTWNFALDYGGADEIRRALARMRAAGDDDTALERHLDTGDQPHPNPDLVVRLGGEQRLSGFMPLQTAYSELFFVDTLWPDCDMALLTRIAEAFVQRRRRFGT